MLKKEKEILQRFAQRMISTNKRGGAYSVRAVADSRKILDLLDIENTFGRDRELNEMEKINSFVLSQDIFDRKYLLENLERENRLIEKFGKSRFELLKINTLVRNIREKNAEKQSDPQKAKEIKEKIFTDFESSITKRYRRISQIVDHSADNFRMKGKSDFYITGPLLVWKSGDKIVRSPICFNIARITEQKSGNIHIDRTEQWILNPTLLISLMLEKNLKYRKIETNLQTQEPIVEAMNILRKEYGISAKNQDEPDITKSCTYYKEDSEFEKEILEIGTNNYYIQNCRLAGIFELGSSSIWYDLNNIIDGGELNSLAENFLCSKTEFEGNILKSEKAEKGELIDEKKYHFISELDISQKKIVESCRSKNLVVQGPPGTGKSETILNIIVDAVNSGGNVLLSVEKIAAVEVIYNRLKNLRKYSIKIADPELEKNSFYEMIKSRISEVEDLIQKPMKREDFVARRRDLLTEKHMKFMDSILSCHDKLKESSKSFSTLEEIIASSGKKLDSELVAKFKKALKNEQVRKSDSKNCNYSEEDFLSSIFDENLVRKVNYVMSNFEERRIDYFSTLESYFSFLSIWNLRKSHKWKKTIYFRWKELNYDKPGLLEMIFNRYNDKKLEKTQKDSWITFKKWFDSLSHEVIKEWHSLNLSDEVNNLVFLLSKSGITSSYIKSQLFVSKCKDFVSENIEEIEFMENFNEKRTEINDEMSEICKTNLEIIDQKITNLIIESFKNENFNRMYKNLYKDIDRKRSRKPLNAIFKDYFNVIKIIFPIMLFTTETTSNILPLEKDIFSKVIFDEASQIFLEKSIPSIFRSRSLVIAGDTRQLAPSLFFKSRISEEDCEEADYEVENDSTSNPVYDLLENQTNNEIISELSLLDYGSKKYENIMLKFHYRSLFSDLIRFSSHAYYGSNLVFSDDIRIRQDGKPIEVIDVRDAIWDNYKNVREAEEVVKVLIETAKKYGSKHSIGVISFNYHQQVTIREKIREEFDKSKELRELRHELENKKSIKGDDEGMFVKNIENVQGDERDIIIFSATYAKNEKGDMVRGLGPLQKIGGEKRLNVAITRAKMKIIVVKSFESTDYDTSKYSHPGPRHFGQYIKYVETFRDDDTKTRNNILNALSTSNAKSKNVNASGDNLVASDDPLMKEIVDKISANKNLHIDWNYSLGGINVDLAIMEKKTRKILLLIKGENSYVESTKLVSQERLYEDNYTILRGFRIYVIWRIAALRNIQKITQDISKLIQESKDAKMRNRL